MRINAHKPASRSFEPRCWFIFFCGRGCLYAIVNYHSRRINNLITTNKEHQTNEGKTNANRIDAQLHQKLRYSNRQASSTTTKNFHILTNEHKTRRIKCSKKTRKRT